MRWNVVRRAHHWAVNRGWDGLFAEVFRRARLVLSGKPLEGEITPALAVHPFDREYGVETGGVIYGEQLDSRQAEAYWATGYYGLAPSVVWATLDRLALDWPRYTFVDIGAGKGRALMLATRYPFQAITGVELSPELVRVASENLRVFTAPWRQSSPVTAVCGDATQFAVPAGPLVVFLYHPFAAPVMRRFLAHVEDSVRANPREVYLLYANPELGPMLRAQICLEVLWDEWFAMTEEDCRADRFGSSAERVTAFRSR